jgi:hypothetical protein
MSDGHSCPSPLTLLVWVGHSCPTPLTSISILTLLLTLLLILNLTGKGTASAVPLSAAKLIWLQPLRESATQSDVIPNRAEIPVRNLLFARATTNAAPPVEKTATDGAASS